MVENLWDENAEIWHKASTKGYDIWRDYLNTPAFLKMLPDISAASGLDIGYGDGYNSRLIAKRCKSLIAIDLSDKFLEINQHSNDSAPLNISFLKMNAAKMSFPNEYFDFVTATMSFMDMAELDKVLLEIYRVLSPTGFLQFSIIHPCFNEHKGQWVKRKNDKILGFLMKDYFTETMGDIHEWQHAKAPPTMKKFRVPRFTKQLSKWITMLIDAGFLLDGICEPYADDAAIKVHPELNSTRIVAHSLIIRVRKNENYKEPFRKIIEKLPGNVWWKDVNLVYLGCNDRVLKVLGLSSRRDFIGKTDRDLWEKNIANKLKKADLHILTTGETINLEEVILQKDGKRAVMLTNKSPLYNDKGGIVGIIGTSTDISKRKEMEEELAEAIRAKSTFMSIASHEVKGPLANVIFILEILKDQLKSNNFDPEKYFEIVDAEIKDAKRGIETINYLLKFLNLDLSKEKKIDMAIRQNLISIIDIFEQDNNEKNLDFHFIEDNKVPSSIRINPCVDEVIKILLGNAVRYSKENSAINVRLSHQVKNTKNYFTLSVEDNGIGIRKEAIERFFSPLFLTEQSTETVIYSVPAIKLSYAKKIVELLDGKLEIRSEVDRGTKVSILIPYEDADAVVQSALSMEYYEEDAIPVTHRKLNILVVEDNPITSKLLKNELLKLRYEVDTALNSFDAQFMAKTKNYDVIFMDISLPGIDGVELRNKLSKPRSDKPIIIAVTSHDSDKDKNHFLEEGFVTVICKPFSRSDIIDCIDTIQKVLSDLGY